MTLSCPKGGESPGKSMCPTDAFLFTWTVFWTRRMGTGHQANLSHPRRQSRVWVPVGAEGVGARPARAGDTGDADQPMAKVWFHSPLP